LRRNYAYIRNHGRSVRAGARGGDGMKILVTGAGGFLGKALVARLLEASYTNIRCNVRRSSAIAELDSLALQYGGTVECCVGDLRNREEASGAVDGVELIFHAAAGKTGTAADLFLNSVVASRNLLDAVGDRKPMRIVLVGSFAVYGTAALQNGAIVTE